MASTDLIITVMKWGDMLARYAMFVMMIYLSDVWGLSLTHAAAIVNIWSGFSRALQPFLLYLAHEFFGNYRMLLFSTISYSLGLGFLFLSTPPILSKATGTCGDYQPECVGRTQQGLLYTSLVLVAIGIGGNGACIAPFLEDQSTTIDDEDGKRWARFSGGIARFVSYSVLTLLLPLMKSWSVQFGVPAIVMLITMFVFVCGSSSYNKDKPQTGSPLSTVFRVIFAAASKRSSYYQMAADDGRPPNFYHTRNHRMPTNKLRCLNKAAIKLPNQEDENRWKLCTVEEVEDTKRVLRMIPMWTTFVFCGIVSSFGNTYFEQQASTMNRKVGNLKLPIQVLLLYYEAGTVLHTKCFSFFIKQFPRLFANMIMMLAMIHSCICCITAAAIEKRRLRVVRAHDLLDKPNETIPMTVFWLWFQFEFLSASDSLFGGSAITLFRESNPVSMESYAEAFVNGVSGVGYISSVVCVYAVGMISEKGGKPNWFQDTLNRSRLDKYCWTLSALCAVALIIYSSITFWDCYRKIKGDDDDTDDKNAVPQQG